MNYDKLLSVRECEQNSLFGTFIGLCVDVYLQILLLNVTNYQMH